MAVFLSAIGLYGVLAYLVTQRTREIGVRLAVGSTPGAIVGLVLREGLSMAIGGVALGAAGSLAFGRLVASQLYGVKPSDPWVMLLTTVTLSAVAVLRQHHPGAPRGARRRDADPQRAVSRGPDSELTRWTLAHVARRRM